MENSNRLTAVIVEDESHSAQLLCSQLQTFFPKIKIVGVSDRVDDGIDLILDIRPNIVFMDINLPDGDGFEVVRRTSQEVKYALIFVTAYEEFALQAFDISAISYLLKPLNSDKFVAAVEQAIHFNRPLINTQLDVMMSYLQKEGNIIALATQKQLYLLKVADIFYCEASNNYTTFYSKDHPPIVVSKTISTYEIFLQARGFLRLHQSFLVNFSYIAYYSKKDNTITLHNKTVIPISVRKAKEFINFLSQFEI